MKKFLAILLSFMLIFTSTMNVFAIGKTGYSTPDLKSQVELTKGLTESQLGTLFKGSGLNQDGLDFISKLRGSSYKELMEDYKKGKLDAKGLYALIIKGGLEKSELADLLDSDGVTESGIDYLTSIGVIDEGKDDLGKKDYNLKVDVDLGGKEDFEISRTPLTRVQLREVGLDGFVEDKGDGEYKINFKNITAANAGKVVKVWEGKENFPKKMILENGINLKVKKMDLDAMFLRTNEIQQQVTQLNAAGTDIGEVTVLEPKLELLPDRIRVTKTTQFTFEDNNQLSNIRENFAIKDDIEDKFDRMSQSSGIYALPKPAEYQLQPKVPAMMQANEEDIAYGDKFLNQDYIINEQKGKVDGLDISEAELEAKVISGLIATCEEKNGEGSNECTEAAVKAKLASGEKTFESTEEVEISLILPEITDDGLELVHQNADDVRMTRAQIINIFNDYALISHVAQEAITDDRGPIEAEVPATNPFDDKDYCNGDVTCEALQEAKETGAPSHKVQKLLNGFTLGEERSYVFSDKLRVGCCGYHKTLYKVRVEFYYAYGFGLRIPMVAEVVTTPALLDNFTENNATYDVKYKMYTVDGDEQHYRTAGLPANKMFDAKEFVFKVTAGIKYDIRVIGDFIDEHGEIKLISLLARLFKDDLKSLFGLSESQIQSVINDNGIDKSQDFIPPFEGSRVYELFRGSIEVPIRNFGIAKLLAKVGLSVNLRGDIKADCEEVNTNGGCSSNTISFKNTDWKSDTGVAYYDPATQKEDALGVYNNFGVKLDNFWYIPVLVFKIFVAGGVKVKIPARGRESFWTPEIVIYEFEFPADALALGTHEGTIGVVDATLENKIYATNPEIDFEDPNIIVTGDNDKAKVSFDTNTTPSTYNQYSINTIYPNCSSRGIKYDDTPDYIWTAPYNNIVYNKDFHIQARGCTLAGDGTEVFEKTVNLKNDAFDIGIRVPEFSREIDSEDTIYLSNRYIQNGHLFARYTLDIPLHYDSDSCVAGEEYKVAEGIKVKDLAKQTLQNDFDVEVRALACNTSKNMLSGKGLVPTREISEGRYTLYTNGDVFTVHNNEFNPRILSVSGGKYGISSYRYSENGYRTYYVYTTNKSTPECYNDDGEGNGTVYNSQVYDDTSESDDITVVSPYVIPPLSRAGMEVQRGPIGQVTEGGIMVVAGTTIKARTCIEDTTGHFVFGSDEEIIGVGGALAGKEFDKDLSERIKGMINHEEIMDIQNGFGDPASDPIFMGSIMDGIDSGLFTVDGLVGMGRMMGAGQMTPRGMRTMSTFMGGNKSQMGDGFRSMLGSRMLSSGGLNALGSMISSKSIGTAGIVFLSTQYGASIDRMAMKGGDDSFGGIVGMNYVGGEEEVEDVLKCEVDRNTLSIYREGEFYSVQTTCVYGCTDDPEPRCLRDDEVEQEETEWEVDSTECYNSRVMKTFLTNGISRRYTITNCENGCEDDVCVGEEELPTTSEDDYINDKLSEINNCFLDLYNHHLENIDEAIADFEERRDTANTAAEVNKYERAIEKLEEIRELYINRYKVLDEYSEEDEFAVDEANFGRVIRFGYTSSYSQMQQIKRGLGGSSFVVTSENEDGTILYHIYRGGFSSPSHASNQLRALQDRYRSIIEPDEFEEFMGRFVRSGMVMDYQG